jgi:Lrp/AsnC family transcriptional regulator for asnA, asnC and gidA
MASDRTASASLDDLSKQIIGQLQEDGRRPYATIGKAVGLSEAAIRQRVQRLLESGAMQIVAVTDPTHVGFARQAMIGVRIDGDIDAVAELIGAITEVVYLLITAGDVDVLAEVVAIDDEHLLDLIGRIRAVPGVRSTETSMYLKLKKQTYNWGIR